MENLDPVLECKVWCSSKEVEEANEKLAMEESSDVWCDACIELKIVVCVKSSGASNGFVPDDMATVYFVGGGRFTTDIPYQVVRKRWLSIKRHGRSGGEPIPSDFKW